MKISLWTWARMLALTAFVASVCCINWGRVSTSDWSVPVDYYEDSPVVLSWIRAAADGDFVPFSSKDIERLGAPYKANWNDWPTPCEELILFLGTLARLFGLPVAANLGVLLAYVTSALAFYAACRLLRLNRVWSFVGAVLFAFTYYHAYRGLHHLLFTYSYVVPFNILACAFIAFGKQIRWGRWQAWLCLVTAAVTGFTNPYHLNMFAQMLCLGICVQLVKARRKPNLQIGIVSLGVAVAGFLVTNLDTFLHQATNGKNLEALQRGYYETELFALKPIELFVPPVSHNVPVLAKIGSTYVRDAWIKGEMFSPYLGIVGIVGLFWVFLEMFIWAVRNRSLKIRMRPSAYSPAILWVLFYSAVGGLNCVIALAGVPLFRGTNRYSIYISALVLLFLVSRISRLTRHWRSEKRFVVSVAILFFGLFDQLPQTTSAQETQAIARNLRADQLFVQAMEKRLPPKAMIFQLPVMPFPESTPVNNLQAYEHLRPYLFSKTMRFSFGSNKGRPREDWQKEVEKLSAPQMIEALERYGFSAIYLNRKGYADQGAALIKQLADGGRSQIIEDGLGEQVCIELRPASQPELPPAGSRIPLVFDHGWVAWPSSPAGIQYWAGGNASMAFFIPRNLPGQTCVLSCHVASLTPRQVTILLNGREVWSSNLSANQIIPLNLRVDTQAGYNKFELITDVHERPTKQNPLPRTFVVINGKLMRDQPSK